MGLQLCKGGGEGEDGGLDLDKAARSSHTTPTHCGCTHVSAIELLDPIVQCGVCCVMQVMQPGSDHQTSDPPSAE